MDTLKIGDNIFGIDSDGQPVTGMLVKSYGFAYAVRTITGKIAVIDGPATRVSTSSASLPSDALVCATVPSPPTTSSVPVPSTSESTWLAASAMPVGLPSRPPHGLHWSSATTWPGTAT